MLVYQGKRTQNSNTDLTTPYIILVKLAICNIN